jgi:hypothetical protein
MSSKDNKIELIATTAGAVLGANFAGVIGVVAGAVIGVILARGVSVITSMPEKYLKKRILDSLKNTEARQVREVMEEHGISVPIDYFEYSKKHPFVQSLVKYRKVFTELELEGKVAVSRQESASHGYVNPPNDWINDWSGRAYYKVVKDFR